MNIFGITGGLLIFAIHTFNVVYISNRFYRWFSYLFPKLNVKIFSAVFILLGVMTFFAMLPLSLPISFNYHLRMIGGYITGVLLYVLLAFLLADLIFLVVRLIKGVSADAFIKSRFYAGTVAIFLGLFVAGYGIYNATQIRITTYEIELQREMQGEMTIVLISDLHLGELHSERRLEPMVAYINSLNPDFVAIAGDIFNDDFYAIRDPERASALLRTIGTNYGVFAVLGNHDTGRTVSSMINFLEESNIYLLNCEYVIIDDRLVLVGRLDAPLPWMAGGGFAGIERRNFPDIMEEVQSCLQDRDLPVIVFDHNPTHIGEYGHDVDLAMFGHTHRGGMFPFNVVTSLMYVIHHGHFQQDAYSPHIIVTSGIHGWFMPLRVGSYNEIVKILVR
ncbi:MAG: metallophosphoesterase [Defluviitaleaceae bacterium]|nr:metallophosphoesterase [Defluviitaleaceae bacterium]